MLYNRNTTAVLVQQESKKGGKEGVPPKKTWANDPLTFLLPRLLCMLASLGMKEAGKNFIYILLPSARFPPPA